MLNKRVLGKTDLMVSEMGLGCMMFGTKLTKSDAFWILDDYLEIGGNLLDTANIYGRSLQGSGCAGDSERIIGQWLSSRGKRDEVVIASKMGFPYDDVEFGTSKSKVKEECEKTLQRLGTDYLDVYYLHCDDRNTPMEESLEALHELIKEGKVRHIGASNFSSWRLERALAISKQNAWEPFCCLQQRYSYLRPKQDSVFRQQKYVDLEVREFVSDTGMTLFAYCPLIKGAYVNDHGFPPQYISADSLERLDAIRQVSRESGFTIPQLVYYWLMHSEPSAIPLVSVSSREQFEENFATAQIDAFCYMERLNQAGDGYLGPDFRTPYQFS